MPNKTKYKRQKQKQVKEVKPLPEKPESLEIEIPNLIKSFEDMASIPSVPTDNLYKFIAIVGFLILVVSAAVPSYTYVNNFNRRQTAVLDIKWINGFLPSKKEKVEKLNLVIDSLRNIGFHKPIYIKNDAGRMILDSFNTPIYLYYQKLRDAGLDTVSSDFLKVRNLQTELNAMNSNEAMLTKAANIGFIIGTIFVCFGFFKWYNKIQIYQDLIIRKEAGFKTEVADVLKAEADKTISKKWFVSLVVVAVFLLLLIKQYYVYYIQTTNTPDGSYIEQQNEIFPMFREYKHLE